MLERWALRGEQLGAILGDMHVVFKPDTELATNVDAGLIAERHVGRKDGRVAAHEVRPLMAVHAHSVTDAVGEVLVIGTVASVSDDLPSGRVNLPTVDARPSRCESDALGFVNDVEYGFHFVGSFSEDEGASDVGGIALDLATPVN